METAVAARAGLETASRPESESACPVADILSGRRTAPRRRDARAASGREKSRRKVHLPPRRRNSWHASKNALASTLWWSWWPCGKPNRASSGVGLGVHENLTEPKGLTRNFGRLSVAQGTPGIRLSLKLKTTLRLH